MSDPPENMNSYGCTGSAHVVRHTDLCAVNLPVTALTAELLDDLEYLLDTGCAHRVAAGLEAAARVDRDLPAERRLAASSERAGRAFSAEPEILDGTDLRDREAVVDLDHVDVLVREFCHPESPLPCGNGCVESRDVAPVMERDGVACLCRCQNPD